MREAQHGGGVGGRRTKIAVGVVLSRCCELTAARRRRFSTRRERDMRTAALTTVLCAGFPANPAVVQGALAPSKMPEWRSSDLVLGRTYNGMVITETPRPRADGLERRGEQWHFFVFSNERRASESREQDGGVWAAATA